MTCNWAMDVEFEILIGWGKPFIGRVEYIAVDFIQLLLYKK